MSRRNVLYNLLEFDMSIFDHPYQRLQYARHQAGFEQATDAARHYGFNENTYRSHEGGVRGLRPDTAKVYAEKFKVRADWLLYGHDPMKEDKNIGLSSNLQKRFEAAPDHVQKTILDLLEIKGNKK